MVKGVIQGSGSPELVAQFDALAVAVASALRCLGFQSLVEWR